MMSVYLNEKSNEMMKMSRSINTYIAHETFYRVTYEENKHLFQEFVLLPERLPEIKKNISNQNELSLIVEIM